MTQTKRRLSRVESMALTRQKLMASALETFMRVGYAGATIDGISEEAGFSRGAFYAHFTSKEDVLLEALASQSDELTPGLVAQIEAAASANEVVAILSRWVDQRSQTQDLAFLLFEVSQRARRDGTLDERFTRLFQENWRRIGEAMRPFFPDKRLPGAPEEIVAIIVALSYGPAVSVTGEQNPGRLVELVLRGLMRV